MGRNGNRVRDAPKRGDILAPRVMAAMRLSRA